MARTDIEDVELRDRVEDSIFQRTVGTRVDHLSAFFPPIFLWALGFGISLEIWTTKAGRAGAFKGLAVSTFIGTATIGFWLLSAVGQGMFHINGVIYVTLSFFGAFVVSPLLFLHGHRKWKAILPTITEKESEKAQFFYNRRKITVFVQMSLFVLLLVIAEVLVFGGTNYGPALIALLTGLLWPGIGSAGMLIFWSVHYCFSPAVNRIFVY